MRGKIALYKNIYTTMEGHKLYTEIGLLPDVPVVESFDENDYQYFKYRYDGIMCVVLSRVATTGSTW